MATMGPPAKFSEVLCIGLGLSGVCLGIQLKKKFGLTDFHLYDRNSMHSGTWWSNRYPGCACDIPAIFYSFSFELNPNWTRLLPSNDEIREYLDKVVEKHKLRPYMTFQIECEFASWDSKRQLWSAHLRNVSTGEKFVHECRLLFSAVGSLVDPKPLGIPGADTFEGPIFHTAKWRSDVDLKDKDVIVIGNGCSATQTVPPITPITKTLTQFIRTPHWLIERENTEIGPYLRWAFAHVPLLLRSVRFLIFLITENDWRMFYMNKSGERMRRANEKASKEYTLRVAPKKYHDILIPDWELACKRRVFDNDRLYLKALNAPNLHLTKDPILEVLPHGVRTATKTYPADVIIMATGFETNKGLGTLRIQGREGLWLSEHWEKMGGPGAYNGTAMNGYPNFFIIYGPNGSTGHSSVIMTIENMVNYALKVAEPILRGHASQVELKKNAEYEYAQKLQAASRDKLWNKGRCTSWYVTDGWNASLYPWSQVHFWWRSVFPTWSDWSYKYTASRTHRLGVRKIFLLVVLLSALGATSLKGSQWWFTAIGTLSKWVQERKRSVL